MVEKDSTKVCGHKEQKESLQAKVSDYKDQKV